MVYSYEATGVVGCIQSRHVAPVSVAKCVSEAMQADLGDKVGYAVRFEDVTGPNIIIKMAKVHPKDIEASEKCSTPLITQSPKNTHPWKFLIYSIFHIILHIALIFLLYRVYQRSGERDSAFFARIDIYMDVENTQIHDGKLCFMDGHIHVSYHEIICMRTHMTMFQNIHTLADNDLMKQTVFPLCAHAGEMISFVDDVVESKLIKYGNNTCLIFVREILDYTAILDVHFALDVYMTCDPGQSFLKRVLRFVRGGLVAPKSLKI